MYDKNILITGISGFAGSYLAEHLVGEKNFNVSGTYLNKDSLSNLNQVKGKITLKQIDLLDKDAILDLIKNIKPVRVFHLAALSSPFYSFANPAEVITNNINAQINLLEALRKTNLSETRILIVSSADIYGMADKKQLPIAEKCELKPASPYSVSKLSQDFLGLSYFLSYGMKIIRVRPFNHIGPRQSSGFVISSICKKIAEIEKGKIEPVLHVGNIEARRDFTDVRDMIKAYSLIISKGKIGDVYNIGSDRSYRISDLLDKLISFSGKKIVIRVDPKLLRSSDPPSLLADSRKIRELTLWKPEIPIEKSLKDTLDYWRNIV